MSYTKGHVMAMFTFFAVLMTGFTGALAHSTPENPSYTLAMATIAAFGNGGLVVSALTLALYASPDNYIGTVGALSLSSRFLGGSVGTSIYFNVFNTQITKQFTTTVPAAIAGTGLQASSIVPLVTALVPANYEQLAAQVPGVTPAILNAAILARQWAFANALKYVWYTTIPFGVISTICCLALPNIRDFMTNRVAVVSRLPFAMDLEQQALIILLL